MNIKVLPVVNFVTFMKRVLIETAKFNEERKFKRIRRNDQARPLYFAYKELDFCSDLMD